MIGVRVRCVNCNERFEDAPTTCVVCGHIDRWEPCIVDDAPGPDVLPAHRHQSGVAYFAYDEAAKAGIDPPEWAAATIPTASDMGRREQLEQRLRDAIAANSTYLSVETPTAAQVAGQVRSLTRQVNALLRLRVGSLNSVD